MARIETDPNYTTPTFSRATAPTDPFKKEDVQNLAAAFSTHVHDGSGKGLAIAATGIPASSITSAMIVDGTIATADLAANSVSQRAFAQIGTGSTTSTTFVDIPGFSATLSTTGGDLLAFACVNLAMGAASSAFLALSLDGVDVSLASVQSTGVQVVQAMMVYRWAAPATGTHTVKGRWACSPSITMQINANVQSSLLIEEMKK